MLTGTQLLMKHFGNVFANKFINIVDEIVTLVDFVSRINTFEIKKNLGGECIMVFIDRVANFFSN